MSKWRKLTSRIIAAVLAVILVFPAAALADYIINAPGEGSLSRPYLLTTCDDLQDMDNMLNQNFKMIRNIDCSDHGNFSMIGNSFANTPFTGTLDGSGFAIIGLHATAGGMFGYTSGATIKDVQFVNSTYTISTGIYAGTVVDVAENGTTLTNVHSDVDVGGSAPQMGGLVGILSMSTVEKSSFTGSLDTGDAMGGLAGILDTGSVIQDSFSHGTTTGGTIVGGLAGFMTQGATINRSYSASTLGHSSTLEGGLIGDAQASFTNIQINDSFSASTLGGADSYLGAVIGHSNVATPIGNVYFDASLTGTSDCEGAADYTSFTCTPIDTIFQPDYFNGNDTNTPFDQWDFTDSGPWAVGNEYPILRGYFQSLSWGDMNDDGIDDSTQGNVFSVTDYEGTDATFVVDPNAWCITDNGMWRNIGPDWNDPADSPNFTQQLLTYWSIDIYCRDTGTNIPVTVIFDKVYDTSDLVLRHFNVTTKQYSTIPATFSTVNIDGTPKTAASYHIADGGPLDGDGDADGFILDPITLAKASVNSAPNTPGAPNTGFNRQPDIIPSAGQANRQSNGLLLIPIGLFFIAVLLAALYRKYASH
jgi:hypothetical protein